MTPAALRKAFVELTAQLDKIEHIGRYFMIPEDDLASRQFENVEVEVQVT